MGGNGACKSSFSPPTRLCFSLFIFLLPTGGPVGQEGLCEEAQQAEPFRQHQQQGEEETQELHDDAPQRERPDQEQAFLQGQAGEPPQHPPVSGSTPPRSTALDVAVLEHVTPNLVMLNVRGGKNN